MSEPMKLNIYTALLNIQAELPKIDKDKTNPHFKNKYASLPHILSTLLPILNKEGVVLCSHISPEDGSVYVVCLHHTQSDTQIASYIRLLNTVDMQKWGGSITYATRYGLLSLLGIAPDLDDDGNSINIESIWAEKKNKAFEKDEQKAKFIDGLIAKGNFVSNPHHTSMMGWINNL